MHIIIVLLASASLLACHGGTLEGQGSIGLAGTTGGTASSGTTGTTGTTGGGDTGTTGTTGGGDTGTTGTTGGGDTGTTGTTGGGDTGTAGGDAGGTDTGTVSAVYIGTFSLDVYDAADDVGDSCTADLELTWDSAVHPELTGSGDCVWDGVLDAFGDGSLEISGAVDAGVASGVLVFSMAGDAADVPWAGTADDTTVAGSGSGTVVVTVAGSDYDIDYSLSFTADR